MSAILESSGVSFLPIFPGTRQKSSNLIPPVAIPGKPTKVCTRASIHWSGAETQNISILIFNNFQGVKYVEQVAC